MSEKKPKRATGRPTVYTPKIGDEICKRISEGESLRRVCKSDHMPCESTVRGWVLDGDHPLFAQYGHARARQAEHYADCISDIACEAWSGQLDSKAAQAAMHGFEWVAGKLAPRKYGPKMQQEISQTTHFKAVPKDDVEGAI